MTDTPHGQSIVRGKRRHSPSLEQQGLSARTTTACRGAMIALALATCAIKHAGGEQAASSPTRSDEKSEALSSEPDSRLEEVTQWFGLTRDDIRDGEQELVDCVRSFAALPREHLPDAPEKPRVDDLKKIVAKRFRDNPEVIAMVVYELHHSGDVYRRGAAGIYQPFKSADDGLFVTAVRGREPHLFPVPDASATEDGTEKEDDYYLPWRDETGAMRVRQCDSLSSTEGTEVLAHTYDLSPRIAIGSWHEYVDRKPILLQLTEGDSVKRSDSGRKLLSSGIITNVYIAMACLPYADAEELVDRLATADVVFDIPQDNDDLETLYVCGDYMLERSIGSNGKPLAILFCKPQEK
jgi:hypothetical protein